MRERVCLIHTLHTWMIFHIKQNSQNIVSVCLALFTERSEGWPGLPRRGGRDGGHQLPVCQTAGDADADDDMMMMMS